VWGVVREGLGESEEGIKDIFPLSFLHCFYLCLLELRGESKVELGGEKRSLEEFEGENKEELEGESKEEFEGENKEELGGEIKGNHLSQL